MNSRNFDTSRIENMLANVQDLLEKSLPSANLSEGLAPAAPAQSNQGDGASTAQSSGDAPASPQPTGETGKG